MGHRRALLELDARLRTPGDMEGLAFPIDPGMLSGNTSRALLTKHGYLDLVFEPEGTAGYADPVRDMSRCGSASIPRSWHRWPHWVM